MEEVALTFLKPNETGKIKEIIGGGMAKRDYLNWV